MIEISDDRKQVLKSSHKGNVVYYCIGCGEEFPINRFLYTCPGCQSLLSLRDNRFNDLKRKNGAFWRQLYDQRSLIQSDPSLKGIFLFHELILPFIDPEDVIYLGEGHTPIVRANNDLAADVGAGFHIKMDGLNPSASFKDRGMASAVSYLNHAIKTWGAQDVLAICASTGDTSAAAALYLSYLPKGSVTSIVLLPAGKVTPQQLSQPLGSGATVIEIPGVFDDCMRIVEELARDYQVFLLNSKNPVRICGQKSYSYEVCRQAGYRTDDLAVILPIGNAGNITAVMEGFIDFQKLGLIKDLPLIIGVQSRHANPVFLWHERGKYKPVAVQPSVAQAAMIGNPVSFPKVKRLVEEHYQNRFAVVQVAEQEIIENMLIANRHGHVVCTQGGEGVAGLRASLAQGIVQPGMNIIVNSTSHQLKFAEFQQKYFDNTLPPGYGIKPQRKLQNKPVKLPASTHEIARYLKLTPVV